MPFQDEYIKVKHPLSLNKWAEETSTYANKGDLSELKNYIPERGCLNTRRGITGLAFTPQTTQQGWIPVTSNQPYPPGVNTATDDFAVIQAIFPMNSSASAGVNMLDGTLVYSMAGLGHTIESGRCTVIPTYKVEGVASLILTDDTAANPYAGNPARLWGARTINAFPQYMPGGSSQPANAFLLTFWQYPFTISGNAEWMFNFGNDANGGVPPMIVRNFNSSFQVYWTGSAGGTAENFARDNLNANQWYFHAMWLDFESGFAGLYTYDAVTLQEDWTASESTGVPGGHFYTSSSANTLSGRQAWNVSASAFMTDASQAYHGCIDYITMWSKPFHQNNSSNVTLARVIKNMAWVT
jgi:hypothetical protein